MYYLINRNLYLFVLFFYGSICIIDDDATRRRTRNTYLRAKHADHLTNSTYYLTNCNQLQLQVFSNLCGSGNSHLKLQKGYFSFGKVLSTCNNIVVLWFDFSWSKNWCRSWHQKKKKKCPIHFKNIILVDNQIFKLSS